MITKVIGLIGALAIGIIVPLVSLLKAFESIENMTPWGWVTITIVSVAAISCTVIIIIITKFFKE
ncbi:MAG: hypothetical protein JW983_08460 [Elusimicrobia bacterium]|nr:hypothetical protein [Elusimicrobiota bacterium]